VRNVSEDVLFSVMRSLLDASAVTEYVREALALPPAAAANAETRAAQRPSSRPPKIGVYFGELSDSLPARRALAAATAATTATDSLPSTTAVDTLPLLTLPPKYMTPQHIETSIQLSSAGSPQKRAREESRFRKEEHLNVSVRAAMCSPGFSDMAGDILRNTMLNLMQEAAFDEFNVFADTIEFKEFKA
jgi:hypothetical protein